MPANPTIRRDDTSAVKNEEQQLARSNLTWITILVLSASVVALAVVCWQYLS